MRAPNKPSTDPLLAALIEKLPAAGSAWPAPEREAWLKMMSMAFNVVYQGDQCAWGISQLVVGEPSAPTTKGETAKTKIYNPPAAIHTYWIDKDGVARGPGGKQIAASDVIGTIYDTRGELSDLGAIVWADGKTGVSGLQLEIAAA